jgi:microcystin-dependent protein
MFGGSAANLPVGWLECNGQSLSRSTYASLFSVLGTTYGAASGSTFNVPNFWGKTTRGADTPYPLGSTGGADTVTLIANNLPAHTHSITDPGHSHDVTLTDLYNNGASGSAITYVGQIPGGSAGNRTQTGGAVTTTTGITGTNSNTTTSAAVTVTNPYLAVVFMIRAI